MTISFETAEKEFTQEKAAREDSARRTARDAGASTGLAVITDISETPHTPVFPVPSSLIENFLTPASSGTSTSCFSNESFTATEERAPRKTPSSPEKTFNDLVGEVEVHLTEKIIPTTGRGNSTEIRVSFKVLNFKQSEE
jgi:hypothetical protein